MMRGDTAWGIGQVWLRYFSVFYKGISYYLVSTFIEPILYMLAFGLGVGALIGNFSAGGMHVSYRSFVFSGIIAQTLLFQGFYEGAFGGFVRMYYQKIFQAISVTPITLSEVLWGELLWDASKSALAAEVVALIGVATGDFPPHALLTLLPFAFLGALLFSGMGLAAAGYARNIDQLSYPQYLFVFPMFLFCGVFYPLDSLPLPLQYLAWAFPLTALVSVVRTLTLGFPFEPQTVPILLLWLLGALWISRRAMFRRLVK
ncbi:MAG TPA: ABC transporter permease [Gallionellaceae bacterium]|nr:ABC transporter permease [Gallionellaceae bacterium]